MLTSDERAATNRQNALKSTGPTTEEGKAKSAQNSRTHGLTVSDLTIYNESPEVLEATAAAWSEALEPQGLEQEEMVNEVAIGMIKRDRMHQAETAILDEQIRSAVAAWDKAHKNAFLDAKIKFRKELPARGLIDLKMNGLGLIWLIKQWENLKQAFEKYGYWNNLNLIKEAVRLSGYDPEKLSVQDMDACDLFLQAICCHPQENVPKDWQYPVMNHMPAQYQGCYGEKPWYERDEAQRLIRLAIEENLEELNELKEDVTERETASRDEAETRAIALKDSLDNRLLFRYTRANESSLDKTLKRLEKMKLEAKKEAGNEPKKASQPAQQNEASFRATSSEKSIHVGSFITFRKQPYEVVDMSDGAIYMVPVPSGTPEALMHQEMPVPDVIPMPISGV